MVNMWHYISKILKKQSFFEHDKGLSYSSYFRLGGSNLGDNGQWVWVSNGQSVDHFAKWRKGEPNNAFENEHCIELLSDGQWNDNNCDKKRKFICENR